MKSPAMPRNIPAKEMAPYTISLDSIAVKAAATVKTPIMINARSGMENGSIIVLPPFLEGDVLLLQESQLAVRG